MHRCVHTRVCVYYVDLRAVRRGIIAVQEKARADAQYGKIPISSKPEQLKID